MRLFVTQYRANGKVIGGSRNKWYVHFMSEIATVTIFLLAIAAMIASFTAVEKRLISAIETSKILLFETFALKKSLEH
jgi:hypothetical protein